MNRLLGHGSLIFNTPGAFFCKKIGRPILLLSPRKSRPALRGAHSASFSLENIGHASRGPFRFFLPSFFRFRVGRVRTVTVTSESIAVTLSPLVLGIYQTNS